MGTPFEKIFQAFLSKTNDFDRSLMSDDLMEQDMTDLLMSAIPFFRLPRVDLSDFDIEAKVFNNDLTLTEIQILATLMKREWYKRFIADTDTTLQKFGEKDFEFNSQANHLKALVSAQTQTLDKEVERLVSDYSRFPNGQLFDYRKLTGK